MRHNPGTSDQHRLMERIPDTPAPSDDGDASEPDIAARSDSAANPLSEHAAEPGYRPDPMMRVTSRSFGMFKAPISDAARVASSFVPRSAVVTSQRI